MSNVKHLSLKQVQEKYYLPMLEHELTPGAVYKLRDIIKFSPPPRDPSVDWSYVELAERGPGLRVDYWWDDID